MLIKDSIYVSIDRQQLHLKRFYTDEKGPPVFMVHGSIENGRIFYSKSQKGLAPYLARQGYDVFVADLRGRGQSKPPVKRKSKYGQTEVITQDLPVFIKKIKALKGRAPQHWVAHSWGGVMLYAYLARRPDVQVASMVLLASKRRIKVFHFERFWKVDLFWNLLGRLLALLYGYFPAKKLGFGSDNESRKQHLHTIKWVYESQWIDPGDNFNYGEVLKKVPLPPTLHLTGSKDTFLGHSDDVKRLMQEVNSNNSDSFQLLSKANGNLVDYDHINILTHPKADEDHFSLISDWLDQHAAK